VGQGAARTVAVAVSSLWDGSIYCELVSFLFLFFLFLEAFLLLFEGTAAVIKDTLAYPLQDSCTQASLLVEQLTRCKADLHLQDAGIPKRLIDL
jgi:hypothetical protein